MEPAVMTTADDEYRARECPLCAAEPGTPCRSKYGKVREWSHIARRPADEQSKRPTGDLRALCCECGNLRTFKQSRNRRGWWGDLNWERDLCDLKCEPCGRITAHAIVSAEGRDEGGYYLVARGVETSGRWSKKEIRRIQEQYPNLSHRYWMAEAKAAWDDGSKKVVALCGERIALKSEPGKSTSTKERVDGYMIAEQFSDIEYEDHDTGLSWIDMECVDCCRVRNERHSAKRRDLMEQLLAWCARRPECIEDHEVEGVLEAFTEVIRRNQTA
jgi:hypothetical protein